MQPTAIRRISSIPVHHHILANIVVQNIKSPTESTDYDSRDWKNQNEHQILFHLKVEETRDYLTILTGQLLDLEILITHMID